jgi:hypothetical protein
MLLLFVLWTDGCIRYIVIKEKFQSYNIILPSYHTGRYGENTSYVYSITKFNYVIILGFVFTSIIYNKWWLLTKARLKNKLIYWTGKWQIYTINIILCLLFTKICFFYRVNTLSLSKKYTNFCELSNECVLQEQLRFFFSFNQLKTKNIFFCILFSYKSKKTFRNNKNLLIIN